MIQHNGRFQLDGVRIDTYLLQHWMRPNGLSPKTLTESELRRAVEEQPQMKRTDLPTLEQAFGAAP